MSCFVTTIDLALADKLREDLLAQGFAITAPPHTIFSANKNGVSCSLYASGKLTVQGKGKDEFIAFYLEPEILGNLTFTHPEIDVDFTPRIGIDEAGKGDFFGPLCIAGVQASEEMIKELLFLGVKDSKKMSDGAIFKMAQKIKNVCPHTVVRLYPKKYNELYSSFHNLNSLLAWGHATAIGELVEKTGCHQVLIDKFGSDHLVLSALKKKEIAVTLTQRTHAESDPVVATASILARAAFVDGLQKLDQIYHCTLPKGASAQVVQAGRALVKKHGKAILEDVAKLHFKTTHQVLDANNTHP